VKQKKFLSWGRGKKKNKKKKGSRCPVKHPCSVDEPLAEKKKKKCPYSKGLIVGSLGAERTKQKGSEIRRGVPN